MSERSPMYEPFNQEEKRKEEKRTRLRKIAEKVAIGGALVGTLAGGTVGYEKYIAPPNEKIMNDYDAEMDKKTQEEKALQELTSDPRTGYVDLDHYLEDYPHLKESGYEIELEAAEEYFKNREKK